MFPSFLNIRIVAGPEHEKLIVYAKALDATSKLAIIARAIPGEWGELREQLRAAVTSVPLNIAEGAGEFSPAEKARSYRMGRRSASESLAVLDVLERIGIVHPLMASARAELLEVSAMLTAIVKKLAERDR